MRRLLACLAFVSVAHALAPFPVDAQIANVGALCRIHGMDGEETVVRIGEAYAMARNAGISEEELLPFVEDILRHKLDCPQMVRILLVAAKLREEGLPYFVVFSKVREGVAKEAAPALVVEVAESKYKTLSESRDVLLSLESSGYEVRDFQNAAVVISSYLEKGYSPADIVSRIRDKGIERAGFAAISGIVERKVKRKER